MGTSFWTTTRTEAETILKLLCKDGKPHQWLWAPVEEIRFRALAALAGKTLPNGRRLAWHELREVVNQCITRAQTSLGDVDEALQQAWDNGQKLNALPKIPFRVVLPAHFHLGTRLTLPRDIVVADCRLRLARFESLEACIGPFPQDGQIHAYNTQGEAPSAYLEATIDTPIPDIALWQMVEAVTTWRAAVNFWAATSSLSIQFTPGPRATIREPMWVAVCSSQPESSLATHRFITPEYVPPAGDLSDQDLHFGESLLTELSAEAETGSTARLALDAVRMFGIALDQSMWHHTLFLLWQVAELLTLPPGERGNHDELCKRLALLSDIRDDQASRLALLALRDIKHLRNDVAHAAASGTVHDSDIRFLDSRCKEAIWWLIRNRLRFPTKDHLWTYFRLAPLSADESKRMQIVQAGIDELRRPGEPVPPKPSS